MPSRQKESIPIKILVVDDERGPRELLKSALLEAGYQVTTAKSGEEACQVFDEKN